MKTKWLKTNLTLPAISDLTGQPTTFTTEAWVLGGWAVHKTGRQYEYWGVTLVSNGKLAGRTFKKQDALDFASALIETGLDWGVGPDDPQFQELQSVWQELIRSFREKGKVLVA